EAAGQALLATLLIDEGGLPALLAEVADLFSRLDGDGRHLQRGLDLSDLLRQRSRQRVAQREDPRGPKARGLAPADPRKLAANLLQPPPRLRRSGLARLCTRGGTP